MRGISGRAFGSWLWLYPDAWGNRKLDDFKEQEIEQMSRTFVNSCFDISAIRFSVAYSPALVHVHVQQDGHHVLFLLP